MIPSAYRARGSPTRSVKRAPKTLRDERIVFEGTPTDLVATRSTLTNEHLAAYAGA